MKRSLLLLSMLLFLFGCQTSGNPETETRDSSQNLPVSESDGEPLSEEQIDRIIKDSEFGFYPVTVNGKPDKLFSDINGDGIDDILVLYVKAENITSSERRNLGANSRLFDETLESPEFTLIAFANLGSNLDKQSTILLGSYKAIKDIELIRQKNGENEPLLLSISFADNQEISTKLVSFQSFDLFSVLDLKKDINSGFYLKDINQDSVPEIIKHQQTRLDNGSTDTVLSLYQWDGSRFKFQSSKTILSELRSYLARIKSAIESGSRQALIKEAFPRLEARKYSSQLPAMSDALKIIFKPADNQSRPIRNPKEILFAEIQENPFPLQNRNESQTVQIYCRMIFGNMSSDFYKATIVLNDNPFTDKQYYFTY